MPIMPVKLGPAGVPLSCKGRTIVEGMDDIISLGLETMEVQTVRMVAPNHFEQYWQAGVLANKTEFEMNIHGPYYSELLGNRVERGRSLAKIESTLQAARTINARHITLHAGHYGGMSPGSAANEQVANVFAGVVDRVAEIWHDDEDEFPVFPWIKDGTPSKIGIETSGRQELWGSLEEVLEVVNHVEGTIPVLNIAHIHARGHGKMRTSEDYGELFDQVRETMGQRNSTVTSLASNTEQGTLCITLRSRNQISTLSPLLNLSLKTVDGWTSPLFPIPRCWNTMQCTCSKASKNHATANLNERRGKTAGALLQPKPVQHLLRSQQRKLNKQHFVQTLSKQHPKKRQRKIQSQNLKPLTEAETAPTPEEKPAKKEPKKKASKAKAEEKNDDVFDFEEDDDDLF